MREKSAESKENKVFGKCTGLTHEGLGIIKEGESTVFVRDLLPDEEAEVKIIKSNSKYSTGKVVQRVNSSQFRVKPLCQHYGECGGCDLLHMSYLFTLQFKKQMVVETLKRIGHIEKFPDPIIYGAENPLYYRNKVQIPFSKKGSKAICGYYRRQSHECISLEECYIQPPLVTDMARFIKNIINELKIPPYDEDTKSGEVRHLLLRYNSNDEYLVVLISKKEISHKEELVEKITGRYKNVIGIIENINSSPNNVILGEKSRCIYGKDELFEEVLGIKYRLSHRTFFQINYQQMSVLYQKVREFLDLTKEDVVIDAYCGVGTISLLLAQRAKWVYGVEIVKEAIEDAKYNKQLNSIKNATFYIGAAEEEIAKLLHKNVTALVVDPPRKGCDKQLLDVVLQSDIEKVLYVSCNPATLARDLSILAEKYQVEKLALVDMFCYASHIECVVLMSRQKA